MHRAGNEYIFESKPGLADARDARPVHAALAALHYPDVPASVGRFEGDFFDPEKWKPEYPNSAFRNMRPDDAFWAARIVSRFTNDAIRAVVDKGEVQRSARDRIHHGDAHQAARQGRCRPGWPA